MAPNVSSLVSKRAIIIVTTNVSSINPVLSFCRFLDLHSPLVLIFPIPYNTRVTLSSKTGFMDDPKGIGKKTADREYLYLKTKCAASLEKAASVHKISK